MAATVMANPAIGERRDRLGEVCLRYINWRDSQRADKWQSMTLPLDRTPRYPSSDGIRTEMLADPKRLPGLLALHNRAYVGASDYQKAGWIERRALATSEGFDPTLIWLAYDGDKPVGYCMARCGSVTGRITGLAVLPEHRRRKIGTKLMQRAIAELAQRGATEVHLEVPRPDQHSQQLYRQLGFRDDA
ncbi:MAG TPA: GNAT family N-acetyltransferase [Armatimonadota bacterium]|jgi:ribosomal protein S18 acetylase RimI-like enzyme